MKIITARVSVLIIQQLIIVLSRISNAMVFSASKLNSAFVMWVSPTKRAWTMVVPLFAWQLPSHNGATGVAQARRIYVVAKNGSNFGRNEALHSCRVTRGNSHPAYYLQTAPLSSKISSTLSTM